MSKKKLKVLFALHVLLIVYSASGILSKMASGYPFLSANFIFCYCGIIALLGLYAVVWQQIIKHLPLTTAYANRAVTIVWGMVWGVVLFNERLSVFQIIGGLLVLLGVSLYAFADKDEASASDLS